MVEWASSHHLERYEAADPRREVQKFVGVEAQRLERAELALRCDGCDCVVISCDWL